MLTLSGRELILQTPMWRFDPLGVPKGFGVDSDGRWWASDDGVRWWRKVDGDPIYDEGPWPPEAVKDSRPPDKELLFEEDLE